MDAKRFTYKPTKALNNAKKLLLTNLTATYLNASGLYVLKVKSLYLWAGVLLFPILHWKNIYKNWKVLVREAGVASSYLICDKVLQ